LPVMLALPAGENRPAIVTLLLQEGTTPAAPAATSAETKVPGVRSWNPADFVMALFAAGMAFQLVRTGAGVWSLGWVRRRATPCDLPSPTAEIAQRIAGNVPRVLLSEDVSMAFLTGWLRPKIILPSEAASWPADKLSLVVAHEAAHIRRRDHLVQPALAVFRILYWWNPLAILAVALLRREREQACDDLVLGENVRPSDYAGVLVEVIRQARGREFASGGAIAMASPGTVGRRVQRILDSGLRRNPANRTLLAGGVAIALPCFLVLSVVELKAIPPSTPNLTMVCEVISLPQAQASVLLSRAKPTGANGIFREAQSLVTAGTGSVKCLLAVTTQSGQRALARGNGASFEVEPTASQETLGIDAQLTEDGNSLTTRTLADGYSVPLGKEEVLLLGTLKSATKDATDFAFIYRLP